MVYHPLKQNAKQVASTGLLTFLNTRLTRPLGFISDQEDPDLSELSYCVKRA